MNSLETALETTVAENSARELSQFFSSGALHKIIREIPKKAFFFENDIPIFGERRVIRVPSVWWTHETVMVRRKGQARYRDLKSGRFIRKP
jgi:hypothetical protein